MRHARGIVGQTPAGLQSIQRYLNQADDGVGCRPKTKWHCAKCVRHKHKLKLLVADRQQCLEVRRGFLAVYYRGLDVLEPRLAQKPRDFHFGEA